MTVKTMIMRAVLAVLAVLPWTATLANEPLVRFGAIADPQYAPVPPLGTRYFGNSLWKLAEAVDDLNEHELDFVVTLGDMIDRHVESFAHILPIYQRLQSQNYFVLGNHEYSVAKDYVLTVPAFLGMDERYYDFAVNGVRFIVIDGNDLSLFANPEGSPRYDGSLAMYDALVAEGAINAKPYNGGISDEQMAWLRGRLDEAEAAGEVVVVMGHYPLFPEDMHNLWNDGEVVALFAEYDHIVAHLNGHNHAGHYGAAGGTHFVTLEGMVETATETAYAIVEVYPDRLVIDGVGRATDRELTLPSR